MQRTPSLSNRLVHVGLAAVVGAELAGIAWLGAPFAGAARVVATVAAALLGAAVSWWLSWAPEEEAGVELADAIAHEDMRGIPRWWGSVPLLIALLGAVLVWLLLVR